MKRIALIISLAALVLTAGCDPAVTVRQGSTLRRPVTGSMVAQPELMVHAEKYRALVGVGSYTPKIRVSNMSDSPISVNSVAVVTQSSSFVNAPRRPNFFPLVIAPGSTELLDVWFKLPEGLQKTFRNPAELRVRYSGPGGDGTARVRLFVAH